MEFFEVGGCVRDRFLGKTSKDIDFVVVMEEHKNDDPIVAFGCLFDQLERRGFEIFVSTPEHFTLRARFPRDHAQFGRQTCDFVMARREGPYSDGRHPDWVEVGTLDDDLGRRDFRMNAIAVALDGTIIDPHGGRTDIGLRLIRCVGSVRDRFTEDALRAIRAIRFAITLHFSMDVDIWDALWSDWLPPLILNPEISVERIRGELLRAFRADTLGTMTLLGEVSNSLREAIFKDGLWIRPTLEET